MDIKNKYSVTLFFTYGVSLEEWAKTGLLERELRLYQELHGQGINVQFLSYGDAADRQWEKNLRGIKLYPVYERLRRPKNKFIRLIQSILIPWKFRHELRQSDLYKTNQIWGGWIAVIAKWLFNKPLLVRCGYELFDLSKKMNIPKYRLFFVYLISYLTYRQASRVNVGTIKDSEVIKKAFGVSDKLIEIRPNWIETNKFAPKSVPLVYRVLFVGRLNKIKQIPLILQALEKTDIGLDIIGDGELRSELEEMVEKLKVDVRFLGNIPNNMLPIIYNTYPIYVICSEYEGNPKTLLEAMACGSAVIGTDVPGIRDIILKNVNGILVNESVSELKAAIKTLLDDHLLRQRLGRQARKQILIQNSFDVALKKELLIYQKLTQANEKV